MVLMALDFSHECISRDTCLEGELTQREGTPSESGELATGGREGRAEKRTSVHEDLVLTCEGNWVRKHW